MRMTVSDPLSASLTVQLSSRFVLIKSFNVFMPLSTRPVAVCIYGVPYISFMISFSQIDLNSFTSSNFLSFLIVCGITVFAVFPVGTSLTHVAGHLLHRWMEINIKNLLCLSHIGPMKCNWGSSFGLSAGGM